MRFASGKQQRVESTRQCTVFAGSQEKAVYKVTTRCMISVPSMPCSCTCRVQCQCPQMYVSRMLVHRKHHLHMCNNRRKRCCSDWHAHVFTPGAVPPRTLHFFAFLADLTWSAPERYKVCEYGFCNICDKRQGQTPSANTT